MRINKFLSIVILITVSSLFYVWQQTEVLRLAYERQKKLVLFQELFDKNTTLRYNIEKYASLIRLGDKVSKVADFYLPDTYRWVRLTQPLENLKVSAGVYKRESIVSRLLGIKGEAEAKTVER